MRLIDADKLLPKLWVCYEENKPIVDAEPTVEAIPIKWLKYHVMGRKDLTFDKLELIWSLIKDWEKENEYNKENASQTD